MPPSATCAHLMEEIGEVARAVLRLARYKPADGPESSEAEALKQQLAEELADAVTFLAKLAYTFDIDLEAALWANRRKCEARYPLASQGRAEVAAYLDHEIQMLAGFRCELESRWPEREFDGGLQDAGEGQAGVAEGSGSSAAAGPS